MTIPEISSSILNEISTSLALVDEKKIDILISEIHKAKRIFFIGAGRSGLLLSTFCMRLNHLGFEAYMAGGIPCPPIEKSDLLIAASGSATTPTVISVLQRTRSIHATVFLLTASDEQDLSGIADHIVRIEAPSDLDHPHSSLQSIQVMRTLFEQTIFFLGEIIVVKLSEKIPVDTITGRHTNLE